jgi:hypothetical protein
MDNQLDGLVLVQRLIQRIRPGMGTPVYDDAIYLIPYSRNIPSRAQLDYDP